MKKKLIAFICALALIVGLFPAGAATVASAEEEITTDSSKYLVGYSIKNITPWVSTDFVAAAFKTDTATVAYPNSSGNITVDYFSDVNFYTVGEGEDSKKYYYIGQEYYDGKKLFNGYSEEEGRTVVYPYLGALVGNQVNWRSLMTDVYDDSGDGKIDNNDGIFATCTAVSYGEKTVLFITVDTMKAYSVSTIRGNIVEKYGATYGITEDQIMISSNHTHSSLQLDSSFGSTMAPIFTEDIDANGKTEKQLLEANRGHYLEWALGQITDAAGEALEEALEERAEATMSKGAINATVATGAMGYNGGDGYHMNNIRHYQKIATVKDSDGNVVGTKTYISSNATPSDEKIIEIVTGTTDYDDYDVTTTTTTSDVADNTMYVLRFDFTKSEKYEPVVFVNWRAHSTMNSSMYKADPNTSDEFDCPYLSSDYANGLRTVLRDEFGCRAAFFLGAAGNVTPAPTAAVYGSDAYAIKADMDWLYEATKKNANGDPIVRVKNEIDTYQVDKNIRTFTYGKLLAEIANHCMTKKDQDKLVYMTDTTAGEISTYQCSWPGERQIFTPAQKDAAAALTAAANTAMENENYTKGISQYLSANSETWFPYRYTYTDPGTGDTEKVILNTRLHYNKVNAQVGKTVSDTVDGIELNTIMLGPDVAFIVSPGELVDYYNDFSEHTDGILDQLTINSYNDWNDLALDEEGKSTTYGMPFFAGYSNGTTGYIGSWLDHNSNSKTFYDITGKGVDGPSIYSPGTYESLTSNYAIGQGEALIDFFDEMLDRTVGAYVRTNVLCEHCGTLEDWQPLYAEDAEHCTDLNGHYYLYEDLPMSPVGSNRFSLSGDSMLCLDLNGKQMETPSRSFYLTGNATVNLMDSSEEKDGIAISYSGGNNLGGGAAWLDPDTTLNLYGGSIQFIKSDDTLPDNKNHTNLGSIYLKGTLNMYGGQLIGGQMEAISSSTSNHNGCGGTVLVAAGGKLNVYGGHIVAGKAADGAKGDCVYLCSTSANTKISEVCLSGDAIVDDIYYLYNNGDNLTISGDYTGTVGLSFATTPTDNLDIGDSNIEDPADLTDATITVTNNNNADVYVCGTNLHLSIPGSGAVATVCTPTGVASYGTLSEAMSNYTNGYIRLLGTVSENITVSEDTYLDLNGFDLTGTTTVNEGFTLYGMDSATDDYTIEGDSANGYTGYGKIAEMAGKGKITGVLAEDTCAKDGYAMITEANKGISFHRVNLEIYAMSLRSVVNEEPVPGIYYKSYFAGDQLVAENVEKYGVALSIAAEPDANNLETACKYSEFFTFTGGKNVNSGNGTLLVNIMNENNLPLFNNRNANLPIYGRAYVKLTGNGDGYVFGECKDRTLKQQVQEVNADKMWLTLTDAQKEKVVAMCQNFYAATKDWGLTNILG